MERPHADTDDDVFSTDEKRRMLEHMERREWSQLGYLITLKVLEGWTDPQEREDFLRYFHAFPGHAFEHIVAQKDRMTYSDLFHWCTLAYRTTSELAASWRSSAGTAPDEAP